MADVVAVDDLVAQVRTRTDQRSSTFVTDDEIIGFLNFGFASVYREIVDRYPEWHIVESTIVTTAGTQEYSVPAGFLNIKGVHYLSGGIPIEIRPIPFGERHRVVVANNTNVGFRIQRSGVDGASTVIRFEPDPGARTYYIEYVPAPTRLAAGADWDAIAGFDEYAIEFACKKIRAMAEEWEAISHHAREMAAALEDIKKMAHRRNVAAGANRIQRTRRRPSYIRARSGIGVP